MLTSASLIIAMFLTLTIFAEANPVISIMVQWSSGIFLVLIFAKTNLKYTLLSGISFMVLSFMITNNLLDVLEIAFSLSIGYICLYFLQKEGKHIYYDFFYGSFLSILIVLIYDYITYILTGFCIVTDTINMFTDNISLNNANALLIYLSSTVILIFSYSIFYMIYVSSIVVATKLNIKIFKSKYVCLLNKNKNIYGITKHTYLKILSYIVLSVFISSLLDNKYIFIKILCVSQQLLCYYALIYLTILKIKKAI